MESSAKYALRLFKENPQLLEGCAMGLYKTTVGNKIGLEWDSLPQEAKEDWMNATVKVQEEFASLPDELQNFVQFEEIKNKIAETV